MILRFHYTAYVFQTTIMSLGPVIMATCERIDRTRGIRNWNPASRTFCTGSGRLCSTGIDLLAGCWDAFQRPGSTTVRTDRICCAVRLCSDSTQDHRSRLHDLDPGWRLACFIARASAVDRNCQSPDGGSCDLGFARV